MNRKKLFKECLLVCVWLITTIIIIIISQTIKKRRLGRCCYFHIRIERELQNNKITIALNKIKIKISLPILNWILNTVMVMVIGNENWKRIAEKEKEISSN